MYPEDLSVSRVSVLAFLAIALLQPAVSAQMPVRVGVLGLESYLRDLSGCGEKMQNKRTMLRSTAHC